MSDPVVQPGMTFDKGFLLTVGIVVNNDRCVLALPMAYNGTPDDADRVGYSLCLAFAGNCLVNLQPMLTSDAYVSYLQAEGFYPGNVPFRIDYAPADWPGTGSAGAMPSQVGGMMYWYQQFGSGVFGRHKIKVGKTFIPGVPRDQVVGDKITDAWGVLAATLAMQLQNGIVPTGTDTGLTWYRVVSKLTKNPDGSKPVEPTTNLQNTFLNGPRRYVVTQRRRLIPR